MMLHKQSVLRRSLTMPYYASTASSLIFSSQERQMLKMQKEKQRISNDRKCMNHNVGTGLMLLMKNFGIILATIVGKCLVNTT